MNLLNLKDGRVSLEFAPDEWRQVRSGLIKVAGRERYSVREEATHDMIIIGGEELIFMDEWDEPCLISMSEHGDQLLRRVKLQAEKSGKPVSRPSRNRGTALAA
jgi:hypothetical protein